MRTIFVKIICVIAACLMGTSFAFASKLIYVNGIQNSQVDAIDTAKRLAKVISAAEPRLGFERPSEIIVVWNKIGFNGESSGQWDLDQDLQELFASKTNEESYAADFNKIRFNHATGQRKDLDVDAATRIAARISEELPSIVDPVDRLYKIIHENLARGEQIIVVAHSQGNLIANLAWAKAVSGEADLAAKNLRIVNVANTARRSPNDLNFTHAGDAALFFRADSAACPENSLQNLPARKGWARANSVCHGDKLTDKSICSFILSAPTFKASNSGSGSADSGAIIGGGIDACLDHSIVLTYMSDAVVEVDIDQGVSFSADKSFKHRLLDFVYQSVKSIADANSPTSFQDDFSGTTVDTTKWNIDGFAPFGSTLIGPVSIAGGVAQFGAWGRISTKNKVTFSGQKIVIEARMAGQGGSRDTSIAFIDTESGEYIYSGDTNYSGWGFFVDATGAYGLLEASSRPAALGGSTNQFMEYRWTLEGNKITIERGPTLANITQSATRTLGRSITSRSFYLSIGTASPNYSPGTWDWVRVSTETTSLINYLTTPQLYDNAQSGYVYGQSFTGLNSTVSGVKFYIGDPSRPNDVSVNAIEGQFTLLLYEVAANNSTVLLASKNFGNAASITSGAITASFDAVIGTTQGRKYFIGIRSADPFGLGLLAANSSSYAGGSEAWIPSGATAVTEHAAGRDTSFLLLQ